MLKKLKAYTLIELVIVMVIVVLMVSFAIPAFLAYGKTQTYNQKIDEMITLVNQTYALSKNPEKGVVLYELTSDIVNNKYSLIKCFRLDATGLRCSSTAGDFALLQEVKLTSDEVAQSSGVGAQYLTCSSDPTVGCVTNTSNQFSFRDSKVSSNNIAAFQIFIPFRVVCNRRSG